MQLSDLRIKLMWWMLHVSDFGIVSQSENSVQVWYSGIGSVVLYRDNWRFCVQLAAALGQDLVKTGSKLTISPLYIWDVGSTSGRRRRVNSPFWSYQWNRTNDNFVPIVHSLTSLMSVGINKSIPRKDKDEKPLDQSQVLRIKGAPRKKTKVQCNCFAGTLTELVQSILTFHFNFKYRTKSSRTFMKISFQW